MTPTIAVTVSVFALAAFTGLVAVERARGMRFAPQLRAFLDALVSYFVRGVTSVTPRVNRAFVRQFLHYCIHLLLSSILTGVRSLEAALRTILRMNRKKATRIPGPGADQHLRQLAEHREESALTEKEKTARKKAALRGEGSSRRGTS